MWYVITQCLFVYFLIQCIFIILSMWAKLPKTILKLTGVTKLHLQKSDCPIVTRFLSSSKAFLNAEAKPPQPQGQQENEPATGSTVDALKTAIGKGMQFLTPYIDKIMIIYFFFFCSQHLYGALCVVLVVFLTTNYSSLLIT